MPRWTLWSTSIVGRGSTITREDRETEDAANGLLLRESRPRRDLGDKLWGYSNPSALPCQATNWSRGTPPSAARRYHQGRLAQRLGKFDELELVADRDRAGDRTVDRAARLVMVEGAGDLFAVGVGVEREREADVDSSDHQHAVLGLDLADRLCGQSSFSGGDLTRLQRASEGAGQSPGGGSDHVVERGRMCRLAAARDAVVVRDLVVDAELDRLLTGGEVGTAQGPANALDPDAGPVDDVSHGGRS